MGSRELTSPTLRLFRTPTCLSSRISTRQLELSAQYPIAALIERPWRIASAKLDVEQTARGLVQSGLDSIRDVRIAYGGAQASERRRALRDRVSETMRKSAELAASRHRSGGVGALEATW